MRNLSLITLVAATGLMAACSGSYQQNPVPDLQQLRANGHSELERGPDKPQEITKNVEIPQPPEKVVKEQATLNANFVSISADPNMTFMEGQSASFKIVGRSLVNGVSIKLVAQDLPAGAVFQAAQAKDTYTLTWTPAYNTVPNNSVVKSFNFKVAVQITDVAAGIDRKALDILNRQQDFSVLVLKNQASPTDLAINLADSVSEDTVTPFQVTVKVPGVDDKTGQKPKLLISYDRAMTTQGNDYRELDGSRYVIADQAHMDPEYIGDYRWKFSLVFDTQNISVQPPQDVKGQVQTSGVTHVRMTVKAFAPAGTSTPEMVKKVQITLAKSVEAPRFDLSGLAKESLELTPGEAMTLNFVVTSAASKSTVKMELPNIKTLAGAPSLSCKASALSAAKQECVLSWKVPCSATDSDITQQIAMAAAAISNGRSSDVTNYTLKTVRSQKEKAAACTPVVAAPGVKK